MMEWRFLDSGPGSGAHNMAVDAALLESHARGLSPATLRVYTWRPAAVSLGHFQPVAPDIREDVCRARGIDICRRPTGGRAILHAEDEVTFSAVVSEESLGAQGVMDSYRRLAGGIIAALAQVGIRAELVDRPGAGEKNSATPACFAVKARCDLVARGRKLVGSAQVHRDGFVLQQNSLPVRLDTAGWEAVFAGGGWAAATDLRTEAGRPVPGTEMTAALRAGFEQALGLLCRDGGLTAWELERAAALEADARRLEVPRRGSRGAE